MLSVRLTVVDVIARDWPAELDLTSNGAVPLNAFVDIATIEARLGWRPLNAVFVDSDTDVTALDQAIKRSWGLADAQLELREVAENSGAKELACPNRACFS